MFSRHVRCALSSVALPLDTSSTNRHAMSLSWPISQLINKSSGICSVCLATRQIHIRDGTIHKHGPRHDLCPGSNKPPLQNGSQPLDSSTSRVQTSLENSGPPSADPVPPIGNLQPQSKSSVPVWSVTSTAVIKRIPKASRHACASHLASLLRKVVANPGSSSGWLDLFNWSQAVLRAPKRGGKRHNLSLAIKHRISSFAAEQSDQHVSSFSNEQVHSKPSLSQAVSAK